MPLHTTVNIHINTPYQRPYTRRQCTLKPIFHWKWGSHFVPNANEIYTKNMKCTWPKPAFCVGTQRNLYSTDWHRGLASGKTQILGLASGVTQILALGNAKIHQHVGISNAKFWHRGHCPTPIPNARYFASQWNIGFTHCLCDAVKPR